MDGLVLLSLETLHKFLKSILGGGIVTFYHPVCLRLVGRCLDGSDIEQVIPFMEHFTAEVCSHVCDDHIWKFNAGKEIYQSFHNALTGGVLQRECHQVLSPIVHHLEYELVSLCSDWQRAHHVHSFPGRWYSLHW